MTTTHVWTYLIWIFLIPLAALAAKIPPNGILVPKIINGTEATAENTKHQVSIRMKSRETIFGTGHMCGGSLIKPTIVLSAAHCFYDDYEMDYNSAHGYFVVLGTLNRFRKTSDTLQYEITHIVYGDFDRPTYENDIAIVFLDGTVPDNHPGVGLIAMNRQPISAGTVCQVTGWGVTETGSSSTDLMTLDVPIVDTKTCATHYGEETIKNGMVCAGYMEGERDACSGDSGGPLVCDGLLVGIVSSGNGCAEPGFPGLYTDVQHYAAWVEKTTKSGVGSRSTSVTAFLLGLIFIYCFK